jgi:site-specific recombinase XerD
LQCAFSGLFPLDGDDLGFGTRFSHYFSPKMAFPLRSTDSIREALEEYLAAYPGIVTNLERFVFFSTQNPTYAEPIKRGQGWKFISNICQEVGLTGNYGTHTLRKTWGYHARMQGVDLALIMHKLNHNSLAYTKRYLGITDDELEAVARRLNL